VTGKELDREVRQELATLAGPVAGTVARHLVMAGRLLDSDPEGALEHAVHARRMGGRVAVVREAAGVAAYHAGQYETALAELRAARRISGRVEHWPLLADCERGVGRPERALELAEAPEADRLDRAGRAELTIVAAGAERDLHRPDAAEQRLRRAMTSLPAGAQWVARLHYALGDLLAEQGRTDDAVAEFAAAEAADVEGELDSGERMVELLG
jgi:tetratricopeptide (TPR) repeat protein